MRPRLILASASPRRAELLARMGVHAVACASRIAEVRAPGESPEDFVARVATEKACRVAARFPHQWVLGADTVVALGDAVLGKPRAPEEAHAMLRRLSGRAHRVLTGFALVGPGGRLRERDVVTTRVCMRRLGEDEIARYVASGEPMDKAGAYAIQGGAAAFVIGLAGSWSNVVGLPVREVGAALERWGLVS